MKAEIHPEYKTCEVTCGCGNTFTTRATVDNLHVEICSSCHPFYTGKQKFVDAAGRVEKFQKKFTWQDDSIGGVLSEAEKQREEQRKSLQDKEAQKRQKLVEKKKRTEERRLKILEEKKQKYAEAEAAQKAEEEAKAAAEAEAKTKAAEKKAAEKAAAAEAPKAEAPKPEAPKAEAAPAEAPKVKDAEKPADES